MTLRCCLLAAATLAALAASAARAHDPSEAFDQLPPPPAAHPAPATCAELARADARGELEGDDARARRERCAGAKQATAPREPARKS